MKTSVLRYRNRCASILTLEPNVQEGVRLLSLRAAEILEEQDEALWRHAGELDMLNKLRKGVVFLTRIGLEKGPEVLVKDVASHHAFVACVFLASQSERLCVQCRTDLYTTLLILAECCPIDLPITHLPPLTELHNGLRRQSIMRKHYTAMLSSGTSYEITLADALRVLRTMERAPSPSLVPVMSSLRDVTEGLRTAISNAGIEDA